jgi:tryptophan-rich sensory protein
MKKSSILLFIIYISSFLSSFLTNRRPFWYHQLKKQIFTPTGYTIGFVRSILYCFIALAVSIINDRHRYDSQTKRFFSLCITNFLCNQAFSLLIFRLKLLLFGIINTMLIALTAVDLVKISSAAVKNKCRHLE